MLVENLAWSNESRERDPDYFQKLAHAQKPTFFWIGCSDSRVPAETVTHASPGELFVLRNIANMIGTGTNSSSALEYAICVLEVKHVIVCGHYGCGGVRAALLAENASTPQLNARIEPLRRLAHFHRKDLETYPTLDARINRLVELNVHAQVDVIRQYPVLGRARRSPKLHGWVYGLRDGLLRELSSDP
ncbi:carbonic anhydrase [Pararobbsia silviterrae]|uniref:Carbonic anhydrase n=1 Tax=Pararobbsia silviterrae TaxID=1792498 RepID=A0A494Y3P6_9BURK|nr:carbonic anhydrase [Pararobbsia silviterrae]